MIFFFITYNDGKSKDWKRKHKDKRNLFRLGKEIKAINDRILRDIKNLFDLKDIINNLKNSDMWRIQLTIANNFICSIDNDEEHVMHSRSDNIEIMINDEADEVIKELIDSLKNRYQNNLESVKGSEFVLDYVHLLYYKCHKINTNCGGSYMDSPDWIINKEK